MKTHNHLFRTVDHNTLPLCLLRALYQRNALATSLLLILDDNGSTVKFAQDHRKLIFELALAHLIDLLRSDFESHSRLCMSHTRFQRMNHGTCFEAIKRCN